MNTNKSIEPRRTQRSQRKESFSCVSSIRYTATKGQSQELKAKSKSFHGRAVIAVIGFPPLRQAQGRDRATAKYRTSSADAGTIDKRPSATRQRESAHRRIVAGPIQSANAQCQR